MSGPHDGDDQDSTDSDALNQEQLGAGHAEQVDAPLRPRPAPTGLSRRDRKAWREIEGERVAAAIDAGRSLDGFRGGFPAKPPKGLGRRGKRAFHAADRTNRDRWWDRKRDSQGSDQAIGVLVLVLLMVTAVVVLFLVRSGRDNNEADTAQPAPSTPGTKSAAQTSAAPSTGATTSRGSEPSTPSATRQSTPTPTAASTAGTTRSGVFGNGSNTSTAPATTSIVPPGVVSVAPAGATVPPDPGRISAVSAAARTDPLAAAKAWFRVVCGSTFTEPFAARYTATKAAMTSEAWAYADPTRDTRGQQWWQGVEANRETRTCTNINVTRFQGPAPSGRNHAPVVLTAERQVTSDIGGRVSQAETISELRMMRRGSDGLWSVGPVVMAG